MVRVPDSRWRLGNWRIASVHHECPKRVAGGCDYVLAAVQHKRLRRVGDAADSGIPQGLAGLGIVGDEAAGAIAGEEESAGRGEEATSAAIAVVGMAPGDLAGLVV